MITRFAIEGLFGRFDYDIKFFDDITILTGPNGYGKSTILRMLSDLANDKFKSFISVSFKTVHIYTKSRELIFSKEGNKFTINGVEYYFDIDETGIAAPNSRTREEAFVTYNNLLKATDWVDATSSFKYAEEKDEYLISLRNGMLSMQAKEALNDVTLFKREVGGVFPILADRLYPDFTKAIIGIAHAGVNRKRNISAIERRSEKMRNILRRIYARYTEESTRQEKTFPRRLLCREAAGDFDIEKFEETLAGIRCPLESHRVLDSSGGIDLSGIDRKRIKEDSKVLELYLEDAVYRYGEVVDDITKVDLFDSLVNEKLAGAKIISERDRGICAFDKVTSEIIKLSDLSSGEQQIIVMYFDLIFNGDGRTMLLDEPELSLHIAWQTEIIGDIERIMQVNKGMNVIIATHSPYIISEHGNKQIDLGRIINGQKI